MKKILTIALILVISDITSNHAAPSKIKKIITDKNINVTAAALCTAASVWDLIKLKKLIGLGISSPFLLHVMLGQTGSIFAANAFSNSFLEGVVEDKNIIDRNFALNIIETAFN